MELSTKGVDVDEPPTGALDAASPSVPASGSRSGGRPPGVLFYLATAVAIVITLDANSRKSLGMFIIAATIWLVIAAVWLGRFALALSRSEPPMSLLQWARWLSLPFAMGLMVLVTRTDAPFDARLALSRGAMDEMAAEVISGDSAHPSWVGMYAVTELERTANGVRFVVDDSGLVRRGFAYSPEGEPELSEANYSPLWTGATFEPVGGGWWMWTETWD
jgi:hypothetical protein